MRPVGPSGEEAYMEAWHNYQGAIFVSAIDFLVVRSLLSNSITVPKYEHQSTKQSYLNLAPCWTETRRQAHAT